MRKVVVYARNKNIRPSDYYRVVQYTAQFDGETIIRSAIPDRIDRWSLDSGKNILARCISLALCYFFIVLNFIKGYFQDKKINPDAIIVVRELFPRKMPKIFKGMLVRSCTRFSYVWDFDDSIIGSEISMDEADIYFKYAKHIVVSTPYLKENLPAEVQDKTSVLATTDGDLSNQDLQLANKYRKEVYDSKIHIVWVATANNIPNVLDVLDYLDAAAKKIKDDFNKEVHLRVVCNAKIERKCETLIIDNITWSRERAIEEIMAAHMGIMPLMNNQFALGKAGFKLIQYMAGGLPIIASDTGFNSTILNDQVGFKVGQNSENEWIDAIVNLSKDYDAWSVYSDNAIKEWNEKYAYQFHLDFWNDLLNNL